MSDAKTRAALLVVDDDRGLLRLAARTLEREGFSVATASSGVEAIAWLTANQPDLLLLDLKLADLNASQLIRQLTDLQRLPPFLIITGQGDERVAVEMMKSGARDYLVKGTEFLEVLPSVVARVLAQIDQERKLAAAETAFRLSEERFRVALKHSPVVVFNQDAELRYTWVHNESVMQAGQELLGRTDAELFPSGQADRLTQIKMRVMMTGAGLRQEIALTTGGRKHYYDLTVEPVRDPAGLIAGITGAAMEITERKRLEEEILHISEMEQRRIGQDLHDGICQHLAGIELKSQSLAEILAKKARGPAAQAEQIARHVRDVIGQTRSLARGLCPFILESEGLVSALRELAAGTQNLFNVKCKFEGDSSIAIPDQTVATQLYRIAQEAVTNAVKHGKGRAIEISLTRAADQIVLAVTDDGVGFRSSVQGGPGMGLRTMQYRAGRIGAALLVQTPSQGGAKIICFIHDPAPPAAG
jgi:two-component system, NarL family, sensor histidine kinase UhpB